MTKETQERLFPGFEIPDRLDEAITVIEDQIIGNVESLQETNPDITATNGERIAHLIALNRARADGKVLEYLKDKQNEQGQLPEKIEL